MTHIHLRRVALSMASLSFSILIFICLVCSAAIPIDADGGTPEHDGQMGSVDEENEWITFPYNISCTPLQVQGLVSYDGKFAEDGTGREVVNVAAILLYNNSDKMVPYASVTVYTTSCRYTFQAFMIPARAFVLVPDHEGRKLVDTQINRIFGWVTVGQNENVSQLQVLDTEKSGLIIQNLSGNRIQNLMLYHRTYIPDGNFYMGGTVFSTYVGEILPGGSVTVYPENYAKGYSRVVALESMKKVSL